MIILVAITRTTIMAIHMTRTLIMTIHMTMAPMVKPMVSSIRRSRPVLADFGR